jgi:hypothetical protein
VKLPANLRHPYLPYPLGETSMAFCPRREHFTEGDDLTHGSQEKCFITVLLPVAL